VFLRIAPPTRSAGFLLVLMLCRPLVAHRGRPAFGPNLC
jgi:hypothetical protein